MIRKEWKRMLALSMTYIMTLSVAAPVKAAEEELGVPTAETAAEVQETPEQFEARTGYHLSEGYTYVLNNGFVILQADGSPQITPVATPEPTPSETPTPTPTQTPEPTSSQPVQQSKKPANPFWNVLDFLPIVFIGAGLFWFRQKNRRGGPKG